jgi:hypothetical protein
VSFDIFCFLSAIMAKNRKAGPGQSSLAPDRTPTYTSNVTTAPVDGRDSDSVMLSLSETLAETSEVETPNYSKRPSDRIKFYPHFSILLVYYRIYAEDGIVPSRTPAPGDPFLGRIKAKSVPPPHRDTAMAVKRTIAKLENIKDRESTSLFLTPYSQLPMGNADKITNLNQTASGPGSTPQEPLAFVAKCKDFRFRTKSEG